MLHKLGLLAVALSLVLPASASAKAGSISGYVRNASGVPQMGAAVEVFSSSSQALKVFTDERGFYTAANLLAGTYSVKVSAPSFLPALREKVGLRSGSSVILNVTLNTLFEAIQFAPVRGAADQDDWKWTLRSVANRPILRVLEDGTSVVASGENQDHDLKAKLSFLAGSQSQGYGSAPDMSTGFSVERSMFSSGTLALKGNVAYGSGAPAGVLRASYSHRMANGSEPQVALTMRRLAAPDVNLPSSALQALALTTSDTFAVGDVLELKFGSELQTIQFMGRVNAVRPFGVADLHLSPNTVLEYQYSSELPDSRVEKGFDSAPADLSESGPHMSMAGYAPSLERLHHQELSASRRLGKTNLQVALFSDRIADPALTGVGTTTLENGEVLPDIYSGTFTYRGSELNTNGVRAVLQRKLSSDLTATLDYAYGGVLDLGKSDVEVQDVRQWLRVQRRHALAAKFSGTVPHAKTRWITSYRWVSGAALSPVDMFNASPGQSDPFLNVFLRQPIPGTGFLPCHMEALVDIRNLLAQGYVPVMGQDGRTVYLVQSARSVRGGLAFTF
jgi:Carboxypeptidase regulatory-like domain